MSGLTFYDYWASSAAYRVRIALNLKGVDFRGVEIDLLQGEQAQAEFRAVNRQGLVPALEVDGEVITQSLAIIDWLDAQFPEPRLIPALPLERARALSQALVIAADIHPLNNLRVRNYLRDEFGADRDASAKWIHHWMAEGFAALELQAPADGLFGGASPNLADICLVPQMYNARRFSMALDDFPQLVRIDAEARAIDAIAQAAPEAIRPG